jgi:hypothetical protein
MHTTRSDSRLRRMDCGLPLFSAPRLNRRHCYRNHHGYKGADRLHPARPFRFGHARPPGLMLKDAIFWRGWLNKGAHCADKLVEILVHVAGIVTASRQHESNYFTYNLEQAGVGLITCGGHDWQSKMPALVARQG